MHRTVPGQEPDEPQAPLGEPEELIPRGGLGDAPPEADESANA